MHGTDGFLGVCKLSMAFWILRLTIERIFEEKRVYGPGLDGCKRRSAIWKANYFPCGPDYPYQNYSIQPSVYYLSLFKIPKGLAADIERLQINFREAVNKNRNHTLLIGIHYHGAFGGLALGAIVKRNSTLFGKLLWRHPLEQHSIWASVIRSKFWHSSNHWDAVHSSLHRSI